MRSTRGAERRSAYETGLHQGIGSLIHHQPGHQAHATGSEWEESLSFGSAKLFSKIYRTPFNLFSNEKIKWRSVPGPKGSLPSAPPSSGEGSRRELPFVLSVTPSNLFLLQIWLLIVAFKNFEFNNQQPQNTVGCDKPPANRAGHTGGNNPH